MGWLTKLLGINKGGKSLLGEAADVVDRFVDTKEDKREFFKEVYKLQVEEKNSARELYGKDSIMQKVYAGVFLVAYLGLTAWLVYAIINGSIKDINQFETGMIGSVWGAMSAKVNTITDFFFGSSDNGEKSNQFKK